MLNDYQAAVAETLLAEDPDAVMIFVDLMESNLHFHMLLGISQDRVICDNHGNLTVKLDEEPGFRQQVLLQVASDKLRLLGVCGGEEGQCVKEGPVPGTPLSVLLTPNDEPAVTCLLTDEYVDSKSLGTFEFKIVFEDQSGRQLVHDPRLKNQGSSGPIDQPTHQCSR